MITKKLVYSTRVSGNGEISLSNQRFNNKVKSSTPLSKGDIARQKLISINGVGPKTADVVLSFAGMKSVIPVDTNIFRVANRIGFCKGRNYELTRATLEKVIPSEKMKKMHILFIRLGKEICKPRNPRCIICPINNLCDQGKNFKVPY